MSEATLIAVAALAVGGIAVVAGRWSRSRETATVALIFPRTTTAEQVTTAARSLAGLLPPWWVRWLGVPQVTLEVQATATGITHVLTVPATRADQVIGGLRAAIPGLRVADAHRDDLAPALARELRVAGSGELRTDTTASVAAGILASLHPLAQSERATIQYVVTPLGWDWLAWVASRFDGEGDPPPVEPRFAVGLRVGVAAATAPRSRHLIARLLGSFHAANGPEAKLVRRLLPSRTISGRMAEAAPGQAVIGADELAAIWAVPVDAPELPGLTLARSRELPPAASVPRRGLVLGDSTVAGEDRPIAITHSEARRGLHVCAPTGAGKSTILLGLAAQLLAAPSRPSLIAVDSKGDLVSDICDRIPEGRQGDVIVLDPADAAPVGFNLIGGSGQSDLVVDHVVSELRSRYGAAGLGPRSEDILRACLTTLATDPGRYTLCEVEPLLTNQGFRQRLLGRLDDPVLESFWGWFASLSGPAQAEAIAPLANKLRSFTLRRRVRAVIGQADGLDLAAALGGGKVVLISLATGLIGDDAAALLGAAITSRLWAAIQARAAIPAEERRLATVMCDEFQDFADLQVPFGEAVAKSRGYGVGWVLAHQHLDQLDRATRQAVLANCRSRLVMQTTATDAAVFAREAAPYLAAPDFQGLGAFEGYATVSTGAAVAPPASLTTRPAPESLGTADVVRAASRTRYGQSADAVDAEIRNRIKGSRRPTPVGEKRRAA